VTERIIFFGGVSNINILYSVTSYSSLAFKWRKFHP